MWTVVVFAYHLSGFLSPLVEWHSTFPQRHQVSGCFLVGHDGNSFHICSMGCRWGDRAGRSKRNNTPSLQLLLDDIGCMRTGIIIHKMNLSPTPTSIQPYLGIDNLISIPLGSPCACVKDNEVSSSIPADSILDLYWAYAIAVVFSNLTLKSSLLQHSTALYMSASNKCFLTFTLLQFSHKCSVLEVKVKIDRVPYICRVHACSVK